MPNRINSESRLRTPSLISATSLIMTVGNRDMIPIMIIKEIPFPIPLSVIRSPNHINNIVPVTILIMASNLNPNPGSVTTAIVPAAELAVMDSRNIVTL